MKNHLPALALILAAALWRVAVVLEPSWFNFSPVTALAFCGALYFRDWRIWLVPLAALTLSDVWLNYYHAANFGYTWTLPEMLLRAGCLGIALGLGRLAARRPSLTNVLSGTLGSSLAFYLVTNTASWAADEVLAAVCLTMLLISSSEALVSSSAAAFLLVPSARDWAPEAT